MARGRADFMPHNCNIPDDYIDKRPFPLFFARDVLQALVAELKAENVGAPE